MSEPKTILITGASSGIGHALALEYSKNGRILLLQGRNEVRLQALALQVRAKGAEAETFSADVTDKDAMENWLLAMDAKYGVDIAFANAGISGGTIYGGIEEDAQQRRIFDVNVTGVINTVQPLIPLMSARGRGHIALTSSMAGFRGLPSSPAYSASKAAVRVWGEALRGELHKKGVRVSVICPGYVDTPMTRVNPFHMPFLMTAEKAARIIRRGIACNTARIAFPLRMYALLWFLTLLPPGLTDILFRNLPNKPPIKEKEF